MTNRMLLFSKALCHSGWLLEFLHSSRIYRPVFVCGKETPAFFFSSSRKPSEGGENTAVPATFARDEVSFFVFLKLVKLLCLHCQSKTLSWSAQCAKHKKNTGFPRMGFCFGFTRIYACVSFNLSQFCTFSKCWKCFFLSYVISTTSQTPLASESKLGFSIGLQTLDTLTLKAFQYKVAILHSRNLTPERMFTKITMGCIPQCNSSFS